MLLTPLHNPPSPFPSYLDLSSNLTLQYEQVFRMVMKYVLFIARIRKSLELVLNWVKLSSLYCKRHILLNEGSISSEIGPHTLVAVCILGLYTLFRIPEAWRRKVKRRQDWLMPAGKQFSFLASAFLHLSPAAPPNTSTSCQVSQSFNVD